MAKITEKELWALYQQRKTDRQQAQTRRRRQVQSAPTSFLDALGKYFGNDPEAASRIEETRAIQAWSRLVGDAAASASQALRIRGKTLIIKVGDPLWMQQLSFLKRELIKRYQAEFPRLGINDIYFTRGS